MTKHLTPLQKVRRDTLKREDAIGIGAIREEVAASRIKLQRRARQRRFFTFRAIPIG